MESGEAAGGRGPATKGAVLPLQLLLDQLPTPARACGLAPWDAAPADASAGSYRELLRTRGREAMQRGLAQVRGLSPKASITPTSQGACVAAGFPPQLASPSSS